MTAQDQQLLAGDCTEFAELTAQAQAWIEDPENSELVGAETKSLVHMMRRNARRARRLARAAQTRMSVSVFGPSQAGKSFLVSVLARPPDGPLVADFDGPGGTLDYIREINPEGEGESTGLVTRFTMDRAPTPDGYPVRLTLLSEADIVRTLLNSFFMDGDRSEVSPEPTEIAAHLDAFKARAVGARAGMTSDDVYEIGEYVEAAFGREAYAVALRPFWEEAATIAPTLDIADRAAFLAPLWGGHQAFCDLYVRLADALAQLGHAEEVFAGLNALVPRETSIIDVKTLSGSADGAPLSVVAKGRSPVTLPRSVVCGLAAELVLPMQSLPSAMFSETDLLDFPGARNRFEQDLNKAFAGGAEQILPELLLRGKVAYLFDRYVQNQEITSMLLCVPDSNMETVDLPGLVQNWIGNTHGATPQLRAQTDCVLFVVLTKFDKHLGDSAAEGGDETRFERRMAASLLEKFGRGSDNWVGEWTPDKPFSNCFWLRNPNYYVDGLMEYDAGKRETRIRPEKQPRIAELRAGCLAAPSVRRHFADPSAAWDAAMSLNDGGVGYLISALERVCKPDSKLRQIGAQLDQARQELRQAISPFHVADDLQTRIAEKKQVVSRIIDDLEDALARHRFGAVLAALMVDQDEIEGRIARVPSSVRITSAVSAAGGGSSPATADAPVLQRPGRPARPDPTVQAEDVSQPDVRTMTLEQFQSETAIELWIDRMKQFRDDRLRRKAYGLGDVTAGDLVAELIHAARRTGLGRDTAEGLKEINFGLTVEKQAQPASILGAESINRFVSTLGMLDVAESDRPQVQTSDGGNRAIFSAPPAADSVDDLPATPKAMAEQMWSDWVFALDAVALANAKDGAGGEINIEQNLRLGQILASLTGPSAA
ncbi:virulence factor SrfC family protein [Sedimentitalea todarodis]|uniref:Virulence factor SrfC family protein n=1 Tax=Sedimentitalea todarodis TaxID=1631240 RepID=A0ABU3VB31_9RHOB|nr:virulence factor SrfC family protein [Sedimentitalea todarodis]MDU9003381.1 virulence factor SrfC family protein [Sedimentitalea todarodis]